MLFAKPKGNADNTNRDSIIVLLFDINLYLYRTQNERLPCKQVASYFLVICLFPHMQHKLV